MSAFIYAIVIFLGSIPCSVESASLVDIARDVRSDRVLLDAGLTTVQSSPPLRVDFSKLDVSAGGALDLFYRFGFYSLSIRVVPRDDPGTWLVREPTAKVFEESSVFQAERKGQDTLNRQPFQIFLCEDVDELYEAYFKDFQAEGTSQPHKLFTGSWRVPIAAKYLGLSPESLTNGNSFVLVKLIREKATQTIGGDLRLKPDVSNALSTLSTGNTEAILEFVQRYGSHYIREVTVGDSIYQAFVVTPEQFQSLQRSLGAGVATINAAQWATIFENYLAPWLVKETGEVKAASGEGLLQKFLDQELKIQGQFDTYPNLVESLLRNPALASRLEDLTANTMAIVGLNLASLRSFVLDPQARLFFDDTINTHSSLFETNVK